MNRPPPVIDMLPDGSFRAPPRPATGLPLSFKLGLGAALVAVVGVSLAVAAVAVYLISLLLPAIILAAFVAWAMFRFRRWQARGTGSGPRMRVTPTFRPRNPFTPGA